MFAKFFSRSLPSHRPSRYANAFFSIAAHVLAQLSTKALLLLLEPFFGVLAQATDLGLFNHVVTSVFHVTARVGDAPSDYVLEDEKIEDSRTCQHNFAMCLPNNIVQMRASLPGLRWRT